MSENKNIPSPLRRRWFGLWKLDSYVLREFLTKFLILLLVFTTLFTLNNIYQDVGDFVDAGARVRDVVLYLLYRIPGNIRFILPITMLLGCMWTMAEFGKNLEVTAMRASGVSLARCGGAIFVMGVVVTGVNIYFNEILVPETTVKAEKIFDRGADKRRYSRSLLSYRSGDKQRRWLFTVFENGNDFRNVTLKTFWDRNYINKFIGTPGSEKYRTNLPKIAGEERYAKIAALPQAKQAAEVEKLLLDRKLDLTVKSAFFDAERREWHFEKGSFVSYDRNSETRFAASSGIVIFHLDVPFENVVMSEAAIPESPRDILNSVKEKDELSTWEIAEILRRNPNMAEKVRAVYQSIFLYRIAFPWASLLAVFLGIPLAVKNERTGSMLAIISAIGLIVIYISCAQICLMLGKNGVLHPFFAGLAPTIGFVLVGVWRFIHCRN